MSKRKSQPKPVSLVDIIIAVYGRFDLLKLCLESIPDAAKDISYHITLIDNNSPDQAEANMFYKELSGIRVIQNKENIGFPRACNQGASLSKSPLLFFLNSDVILFEDAIKHLVMAMDNPKVGAVGMKLLFPPDVESGPEGKIQHVGLYTDINGMFQHLFIGWSPDNPKVLAVRDVLALTGAALMTRHEWYRKLGGFDEIYGGGTYEDVDYCMKLRLNEKDVIVEQKAMGYHYTNASANEYKIGFPIQQNKSIFEARWAGKYPYTEYLHA